MEKFDLQAALAGAPCRTRDGRKAYVRYIEKDLSVNDRKLLGYIAHSDHSGYVPRNWALTGVYFGTGTHQADIVGMYEPEFKHWYLFDPCIEQLQIRESLVSGSGVYVEAITSEGRSFTVHLARDYITDPVGTVYTR